MKNNLIENRTEQYGYHVKGIRLSKNDPKFVITLHRRPYIHITPVTNQT